MSPGTELKHAPGGESLTSDAGADKRRWGWSRDFALRIGILGMILALWQWIGQSVIGVNWVSSPSLVLQRLMAMAMDGSLARNTAVTLEETVLGLLVGTVAGVVVGILISRAPAVIAAAIDPYLMGAYSLPRVALAPFFILWFGIGLVSKAVLVVSVVGFVVLFNVRQGFQMVDADIVDVLRSMRADRWEMVRYVIIPSLIPWILSAVKISVGMALVSAVVGEMVGATQGLGWYVVQSLNQFDMTGGVTSLIVMAVLALVLYGLVGIIERRICRWQASAGSAKTTAI